MTMMMVIINQGDPWRGFVVWHDQNYLDDDNDDNDDDYNYQGDPW